MAALVPDAEVPVAVLDEDSDIFVTQVPSNIVKIIPRLRRLDGQREIPAAQPRTPFTLALGGHP
jgi:hypothetical protein